MAIVVLNLGAGGGRAARLLAPLREALRRHHPDAVLHASASIGQTQRAIAAAPRGQRVVVVGGDGTLHHVLRPLLDGGHTLALVPAGSGDDIARTLKLRGLPWWRAMSRALTGRAADVDIGWIATEHEQRPFLSSLAAGFDAAVALRALRLPAWSRGSLRYLAATLGEIGALRLRALRLEVDDALVHDGPTLLASTLNTPTYGGGMPAVPQARLDDGRLDLLLAGSFTRGGTLAMLPRLMLGRHLRDRRITTHRFAKLRIEAAEPLPLAADGEPLEPAKQITVRVGAGRLRVVAGAAFVPSPGAPARNEAADLRTEPA